MGSTWGLRLKLLGSPSVVVGGGPANVGSNKALGLLAYLAARRGRVMRTELDALLWPEAESATARRSLRGEISRLRQILPETALLGVGQQLQLHPAVDVDLWRFDDAVSKGAWERAATAYAGDLLEGLHVRHAEAFESWLAYERERLQLRYLSVLQALCDKAAHAGEIGAALAYSQQIIRTNPLSEAAYIQAMRWAKQLGETAVALDIYHRLQFVLRRDFGIAPSAEAAAVAREVASGGPLTAASPMRG